MKVTFQKPKRILNSEQSEGLSQSWKGQFLKAEKLNRCNEKTATPQNSIDDFFLRSKGIRTKSFQNTLLYENLFKIILLIFDDAITKNQVKLNFIQIL